MDVTFNNVLEGTRQYFMGVPKPVQGEGPGQPVWPAGAPLPEEGAPAQSGAPAPSSRPPSAAAAPPAPVTTPVALPPRPPSEPIEPEPHIIHKATVMREAAEKRRELPEVDDEEEQAGTLSPPSHIIRKPPRTLPSPAPAPAAPCPSPARPPSEAPLPPPPSSEPPSEPPVPYRPPVHRVQTPTSRPPDPFAQSRPPDPHSASRPPESYGRYHYESPVPDGGRNSHSSIASPQPSMPARHSPKTYARLSGTMMPQHAASRLREGAAHSPPAQRYAMPPSQPPPPHNDRVPPIHHPQPTPPHPPQRLPAADARSAHAYPAMPQRRETSPYARPPSHYDRHLASSSRKYDQQHSYPGYRPSQSVPQVLPNHRAEPPQQVQYKHASMEAMNAQYAARIPERPGPPSLPQTPDSVRLPPRVDYFAMNRSADTRSGYHYQMPSTSSYSTSVPPGPSNPALPPRSTYRSPAAPKTSYEYSTSHSVQTSPARSTSKPGYANQQARMTVSVTSLVNQMNQSKQKRDPPASSSATPLKQKRESPLDLSVKTVKNSADSSTTQDDVVDSASVESKNFSLQPRPPLSNRHAHVPPAGYVASHKVDFAPNFNQYGERSGSSNYNTANQPGHPPVRYNGTYDSRRPIPEPYPVESPHHIYHERSKYNMPAVRAECVPKIDLTRPVGDLRHSDNRIRDDRNFIIEERKRPAGPIVSNIPEKIVRYETWTADSRIDRMNQSAREQHELLSRPVYSYNSHKQFEAYQNDQKRASSSNAYRESHVHGSHRYPGYPGELPVREIPPNDYHPHYHDRNSAINSRHQVIQKIPSHRDPHPHHPVPHSRVPANKSVLSILRNSLETKQSGNGVETARSVKPDIIVIDDVEDSVIEITDLTKDNDPEMNNRHNSNLPSNNVSLNHHIQMPKAVDSIPRDSDYQQIETDVKSKSPENDVASRIRTKAELKVMPPSQDNGLKPDNMNTAVEQNKIKQVPKSQKQHLFNQIREDLRLESVIKIEKPSEPLIAEVKSEPMNIEEIERDAVLPIKTENTMDDTDTDNTEIRCPTPDDLDWASACDNFMEQLKTGVHKKKNRKRNETINQNTENEENSPEQNVTSEPIHTQDKESVESLNQTVDEESIPLSNVIIKQEPMDDYEVEKEVVPEVPQPVPEPQPQPQVSEQGESVKVSKKPNEDIPEKPKIIKKENTEKKSDTPKKSDKQSTSPNKKNEHEKPTNSNKKNDSEKGTKVKHRNKNKGEKASSNQDKSSSKKEVKEIKKENKEDKIVMKTVIKEEQESTDDDEPLIKSKLLKEKQQSERLKYQILKDFTEKSAYVKLECCDVDVNKNTRKSLDSTTKEKDKQKGKVSRQSSRSKAKSLSIDNSKSEKPEADSSSDSDDDLCVASRLRVRKNTKTEDSKPSPSAKTPAKSSPSKKLDTSSASNSSTPVRKPGFGDGSDFHPGWEEELYRYKRSLRMPKRLIAIPRGRSGGPFVRGSGAFFSRGTTSLPDLDPAPLSPAPSSAPSAATDDLYARRPDKLTLDSDLDSNSSYSAPNRLHYDSEASTSTVFSSKPKKKGSSIVDVLIKKCGRKEDIKKKNKKDSDDKTPKIIPKSSNTSELLSTPSLGLLKNSIKGSLSAKKEKLVEDIFYLGAFRKETVTAYRNDFLNNTEGLLGATEEFTPVVLKSRTRTESRVLKQRATIKEVFGDERPASAPPIPCSHEESADEKVDQIVIKKEPESKPKLKSKKLLKDKLQRRSSTIRDGLRSTKSLKRNDAKGRLMRLKKRNSLMKFNNKRIKGISANRQIKESSGENAAAKTKAKDECTTAVGSEGTTEVKKRFKRLFARRKFSSGFDYIRKKKKIIRREDNTKIRRAAPKPSPESVHDIQREIKGWFINKSVGETHLHRAARLGYTDCVAYCLEKMEVDPSAKDNAGFTPLHVAAAKGHVRIARLLLQYGANVSAAAQGGIRPLHEASENGHVEVIRLLLSYGADPLLGTYSGQTPEELSEGPAARLLQLHIADVQGYAVEPWRFPPPAEILDREELGCDPLASPPPSSPPPPPDSTIEIQCTEAPLPPFYSLRNAPGQPADGLWCLLQDITSLLQIKSKDSLLKQIHCGSGSPKELLREIRTQEFLERAQCHQLLCAGEKVNVRASKVALVRVTDKLRQLLKIETVLVS